MVIQRVGNEANPPVIMISGMFFPDSYHQLRELADRYYFIIPNLPGYGEHTDEIFDVDKAYEEILEICKEYAPAHLVGFSVGADIAFKLVCEHQNLFTTAVIISPVLLDKDTYGSMMIPRYHKDLSRLRKPFFAKTLGRLNGLKNSERNEFAEKVKYVKEESIDKSILNGITFETVPGFADVEIPVVAMAGIKEKPQVLESVKRMARMNENCVCEILKDAEHNIPSIFGEALYHRLEELYAEKKCPYRRENLMGQRIDVNEINNYDEDEDKRFF